MEALFGFLTFFVIAIIGWAIAEVKGKLDTYADSEAEKKSMEQFIANQQRTGYEELTIQDVVKSIATNGFKTV